MQWAEVVANPSLRDLPFKIELNQWGLIEMSPASTWHSGLQGRVLAYLFKKNLGGEVAPEMAVATRIGVRVADASWRSAEHIRVNAYDSPLSVAPELCIEVRSESNTNAEFEAKTAAYLAAGALEVWWVELDARVRVFDATGEMASSVLVGELPVI